MFVHQSISNEWSNIKTKNNNACALFSEIYNVGSRIESSKKRITWKISINNKQEHEISLTHSLASGKKVLRVDGTIIHQSKSLLIGEWNYSFHVKGNHLLYLMIKPSLELNDMYDLIVDGVSFRRLPKGNNGITSKYKEKSRYYDDTPAYQSPIQSQSYADFRNSHNSSPRSSISSIGSNDNYQLKDKSLGSWTCRTCTLINEKPHALVCDACFSPRNANIFTKNAVKLDLDNSDKTSSNKKETEQKMITNKSKKTTGQSNLKDLDRNFDLNLNKNGNKNIQEEVFISFETPEKKKITSSSKSNINNNNSSSSKSSENIINKELTNALNDLDFSIPQINSTRNLNDSALISTPSIPNIPQNIGPSNDLWTSDMISLDLMDQPKPTTTIVKKLPNNLVSMDESHNPSPRNIDKQVMPLPIPSIIHSHNPINNQKQKPSIVNNNVNSQIMKQYSFDSNIVTNNSQNSNASHDLNIASIHLVNQKYNNNYDPFANLQ